MKTDHPEITPDNAASAAATKAKPYKKLFPFLCIPLCIAFCFAATCMVITSTSGSTIWNLNSPRPSQHPAAKARSRLRAANVSVTSNSSSTES